MKEHKMKIRIIPSDHSEKPLDSKSAFWNYVSSRIEKESNNPEKLEYTFRKNFARELKEDLNRKFQAELHNFELNYDIDLDRLYKYSHFFFKGPDKQDRGYFYDYFSSISKLQELKNEYFKDNIEYQRLLNKNILATQIDFGIQDISYSSLGFDLSIEPIEKAIQLFDNNFELFRMFLDQYIPESFLSSISAYDDKLPITTTIDYSQSFKDNFEKPFKKNNHVVNTRKNEPILSNKWDKAKWVWSLANGSLIIPVVLSLIILYIAFNKIESAFKVRQENYQKIQIENDKMLKNYQELIELQKETYDDLIEKIKNDTIR